MTKSKEFRVCVYGGRKFVADRRHFATLFLTLLVERGVLRGRQRETVFVSGGAQGADEFVERYGRNNGNKVEVFFKKAGPIRNQAMVDSIIDLGIELPGGNRTADMRRRLTRAGVTIIRLEDSPFFKKRKSHEP